MMGYRLGKAKFNKDKENRYLLMSLLLPIVWHGAFDFILLAHTTDWEWYMIPFMGLLWLQSMWKVERANAVSPYRTLFREDKVKI